MGERCENTQSSLRMADQVARVSVQEQYIQAAATRGYHLSIRSRRRQGLFKQRVMLIKTCCRITPVDNLVRLIASHCKPSASAERLDCESGY